MEIKPHGFYKADFSRGGDYAVFKRHAYRSEGNPSNRSAKQVEVAATLAVSERFSEDLVYSY